MGAGKHGGFGNTYGRKHSNLSNNPQKKGTLIIAKANHTRESLIKGIDGYTAISSAVAAKIRSGDIRINVLGDKLFSEYLGVGESTLAMAVGKHVYLRASSANIISELVHEGNHALDYLSGISENNIKTWPGEIRAYRAEREFQIKSNRPVDFANDNDLLVHVWSNYEREVK
jgi:hypothetical protein